MNFLCPCCKRVGVKAHHKRICRGCASRRASQFYAKKKTRSEAPVEINPELSIYALRFKKVELEMDLARFNEAPTSNKTIFTQRCVENQLEAVISRINELSQVAA